jgi:predicted NBD/HSP70 family sugar kinase
MSPSRLSQILAAQHAGTPGNRIVRAMSERGALSAAEIARATGLARSTISTALSELKESGIVIEAADQNDTAKGVGRPAITLKLNPEAGTCVGVHLSLDSIQLVLADVSHSVIAEKSINLGVDYPVAAVSAAIKTAVARLYEENGLPLSRLLGLGVSVSGPVGPDGVIRHSSIVPSWTGTNVPRVFGELFRCPVFADNESNCAAVAEMMWGAAQGERDFVLFKIDLGVGGAIVHGGEVIRGIAGGAGEFGHISVEPNGDLCRCGNRGCLEIYASFNRPLAQMERTHGKRMTMDDVILLAENGDTGAQRLIADTGEVAGRGLAIIGTIINPPLIIIGGRLALAGNMLIDPLRRVFEKHTHLKPGRKSASGATRIAVGDFTGNDSLLGAVGMVLRSQGR